MMSTEEKYLNCINCPMGCKIHVTLNADTIITISGNTCPRGEVYARQEIINPQRILTTTVRIQGGMLPLLPVVSQSTLPKRLIFDCVKVLQGVQIKAPVKMGDVIVQNILNSGVDIIASRDVKEKST